MASDDNATPAAANPLPSISPNGLATVGLDTSVVRGVFIASPPPDAAELANLMPNKVELASNNFAPIGIAGGMGMLAGIELNKAVMDKAYAYLDQSGLPKLDQSLPPIMLASRSPEIGDRTAYINNFAVAQMSEEKRAQVLQYRVPSNPLYGILQSIKLLRESGAKVYAVPCNTAHNWAPFFEREGQGMHFVHIVDAALNQALKHPDIQGKLASGTRIRIGLLATKGTVQMGLYQNRLEELKKSNPKLANFEIVVPSENIQENYITKGIYDPELGVKANNLEAGGSLIKEGARQFIADAAAENKPIDMVALACTELPLVVKEGDIRLNGGADGASMPIIDASDALAAEVLAKSIELGQRRENAAAPERRTEGVLPAVGNTIANVARTATSWAESLAAHSSSQLLAPAASAASPAPASSPDVPAAPPVVPVAPQASLSRGVGRR